MDLERDGLRRLSLPSDRGGARDHHRVFSELRQLRAREALLTLLPAAVVFAVLWPIARPPLGGGDTFQFWYAGYVLVTGGSPYDQTVWESAGRLYGEVAANTASMCRDPRGAVCVWLYPPPTAWLFAPFGLFAPPVGTLLVDIFVVATTVAGVIAAVHVFGPSAPAARALLLASAVGAHAFVANIHAGHFVGLLLLGVSALTIGLRTGRSWPVALGALILLLKAHLFVVLGVMVVVWLVAHRAWSTTLWTGASLLAVTAAALARSPEAPRALLEASPAKSGIALSTTWRSAPSCSPPRRSWQRRS